MWLKSKSPSNIFRIGTKNFGYSNGAVYKNRFKDDYLNSSVNIREGYQELNENWKKDWNYSYIDLISFVATDDGMVRVYTEDGKFIIQDCLRLTEPGAKWYASVIDWSTIFR